MRTGPSGSLSTAVASRSMAAQAADREAETRRLIAFSGLAWSDSCLKPEQNKRDIGTASAWQARQPVYTTSLQRWRRYEPWLGDLRQLLSPPLSAPQE